LEQRCKGLKAELKKVNAAKENMKRRVWTNHIAWIRI
jgi:hypothetical protein